MLRLDMEAVDVVQTSVIGFGDDRQQPRLLHLAMPHGPHNGCVSHGADAVRVSDEDRAFEETAFVNPGRAGHLAVAVD